MKKTANGLVEYCKAQVGKPYWFGTFGNTASSQLLSAKRKQYPSYYDQAKYKVKFTAQFGERVHDCVGLIKGYLWSETPTSKPVYKASQDVSAGGMLEKCVKKGKISTIPEIPGTLVFMKSHIGVYIGDGEVIEAKGHDSGVVKTKLKGRGWTEWGLCPWIEYPEEEKKPEKKSDKYFPKYEGNSVSIVDALIAVGAKWDRVYRGKIANANGINFYVSSAAQNTQMVKLIKAGKLIKP
jgi:hypothetical protein